jgi:hypothetical protein
MEPKLIAPVAKRFRMLSADSTSSSGTEGRVRLKEKRLRRVAAFSLWSFTDFEYFLKTL